MGDCPRVGGGPALPYWLGGVEHMTNDPDPTGSGGPWHGWRLFWWVYSLGARDAAAAQLIREAHAAGWSAAGIDGLIDLAFLAQIVTLLGLVLGAAVLAQLLGAS